MKTKPTSRVSFIALRKRMMESAPTKVKALATLEPMMSMMSDTTVPRMTRVWTYDCE